ncbi:MAG: methyl-accepting chemotaxis protein [Chlamydiales bacterium]|nr:methyl-accepting chemotaxis protein [Chlamydiia bacterium]MCP5508686.1 methyl-accepting chemotaxis protein [Chlamydiales bacterium]
MKWIKNLSIKGKFALILAPLLLTTTVFAFLSLSYEYEDIAEMYHEENLGNIAINLYQTAEGLLDENLADVNDESQNNLNELRQHVDRKISTLEKSLNNIDSEAVQQIQSSILPRLKNIGTIRSGIDSGALSQQAEDNYYQTLHKDAITAISAIANEYANPTNARMLLAYTLILGEEQAAYHERTILYRALKSGSFTTEELKQLFISQGTQQTYRDEFLRIAFPEQKELFQDSMKSGTVQRKQQIANLVTANMTNQTLNVDAQQWWQTQTEYLAILHEIQQELIRQIRANTAALITKAQIEFFLILFFTLLLLSVTGILSYIVVSTITKSIKTLVKQAEKIREGDLTATFAAGDHHDEFGELERAFEMMVVNLRELTRKLQEEINTVSATAEELASSITSISSGTSETASAVTETTSTAEELKQTAQVSSEKAKEVSVSADDAIKILKNSENSLDISIDDMRQIRERMSTISSSIIKLSDHSQAIGKIIDTVNDLAEQSNLLAVNAAIEAAKAGDRGRGFAVVAQEVRSLAEQSKQATIQVHAILNDIQNATSAAVMATEQGTKAVAKGAEQSERTTESIRALSTGIGKVAKSASQIAASSQQQLIGVSQVTEAMTNIKDASNQHVNHMQQIEEAVNSLNAVGASLKTLAQKYKM